MEWISVQSQEPEAYQRIAATNGRTIHVGTYYIENGKFALDDDLRFDVGGMSCDLEDHYTHWMPLPEPPKP